MNLLSKLRSDRPAWVDRALPVVAAVLGGFVTVAGLIAVQNAGAPLWVVNAAMLLPGAACCVLVSTARRRWYRWLVLLVLAQIVYPWFTALVLLVGVSWALWRTWVERPTTTGTSATRPAGRAKAGAR